MIAGQEKTLTSTPMEKAPHWIRLGNRQGRKWFCLILDPLHRHNQFSQILEQHAFLSLSVGMFCHTCILAIKLARKP